MVGAGMADAGDPKWLMALKTALGTDALTPVAFSAVETISAPFDLTVEAVSRQRVIDPDALLFQPATLTIRPNVGAPRLFNGQVRAVTASGMPQRGWWHYTLQIVPKLWFMGQTADCRVFQQVMIKDILTTICGEAGQALSLKVTTGSQQDYVTQYNETDLQFISRLMEQAGFFYFFEHTDSTHTLVVADANTAFPSSPSPTLAVIHEGGGIDVLTAWQKTRQTAWGSARLLDYDLSKSTTPVDETTASKLKAAGLAGRDVTLWPALSIVGAEATARTKAMVEAAELEAALIASAGRTQTLSAGSRFKLLKDPFTEAANMEHVVRRVVHSGSDETYLGGTEPATYSNTLSVFPATVPYRQKMTTPRPAMGGIFSAVVLGDAGEEIHADKYNRVKVRLLWDHRADTVADKGIWVRVIQPWAGDSWGWQHLPRVGTEVAVSFMDGDPDRPVVVGGMYNGQKMPVFAIPGEQNKSGWRTRSTEEGGTANCSEFSVDDTKGSELMFVHAEKDMTTEVEHDQKLTVGNDRTVEIKHDEKYTVDNDLTTQVKNDEKHTVDNDRTHTVKNDEKIKVGNNQSVEVDAKQSFKITSGRETKISSGGDAVTVSAGDFLIKVSSGQVSIEAMTAIELKCGSNSVKIDPSGVTITGTMVKLNGQAMVQVKGPMTQVNGDGMLMMKGGIVMVN